MSELKVYVKPIKTNMFGKMIVGQSYYLKSEADKVIAKKDAEIAELKKKLMPCLNGDCILTCEVVEKYGKENAELKAELDGKRHSDYKRCLAMAKWCEACSFAWSFIPEDDEVHKSDFYGKWKLRWMKLAEKFKEASNV